MANNDLDDLGDLFRSLQVGKNVASHGFFGAMNRADAEVAAIAAAVGAGEAALAAGADPVTAAAAAGAAGEIIFEPRPRYAKKSAKRATARRVKFDDAQDLKIQKDLRNFEKALQDDERRRRARARSGVPYKGRLSKKSGKQTLRNRLYSMARAAMTRPKTITRRRPVKNVTMK